MSHYDVFNGDADGICALHQLRLEQPRESTLVTGTKRDIRLLQRLTEELGNGDSVTVLDISLDSNRDALQTLLDEGVAVDYIDHHFAGEIPDHTNLSTTIDTAAEICTSLLVDRRLGGAFRPWAVTAAFGDNLDESARRAAQSLELDDDRLASLRQLGILLNYNGYGVSEADLHFSPAQLYRALHPYADPFDFIAKEPAFERLLNGYEADMAAAGQLDTLLDQPCCQALRLPDEAWARRVSGVLGNQLAQQNPGRAHALLTELDGGDYRVSVRAPLENREGADTLCLQFPTGGGRKAAAGINQLPSTQLQHFLDAFSQQFGG